MTSTINKVCKQALLLGGVTKSHARDAHERKCVCAAPREGKSTRMKLFFLFSEEIRCWRTSSSLLGNVFLLVLFKETSSNDVFLVEINVQTILPQRHFSCTVNFSSCSFYMANKRAYRIMIPNKKMSLPFSKLSRWFTLQRRKHQLC